MADDAVVMQGMVAQIWRECESRSSDVLVRESNERLPRTSDLLVMDEKVKLDAWGSPFCIIPVKGKVAIVSGGPSHVACDALPLTPKQIAVSSRALYVAPLDVVVVTVGQPSATR